MTPALVVLRFAYYNLAFLLAAYGGDWVTTTVSPVGSLGVASVVGAIVVGVFPRLAESGDRAVSV